MSIPSQNIVAEALLVLLYNHESGSMHCHKIYDILSRQFPELTHEEIHKRYKNSRSHWANRVQFARLSLIEKGYIYPKDSTFSGGRNYWTITDPGRNYVERKNMSKSNNLKAARLKNKDTNQHNTNDSTHLYPLYYNSEESEDVISNQEYYEGTTKQITVNVYERNAEARIVCIQHYGLTCTVCGFNFESF